MSAWRYMDRAARDAAVGEARGRLSASEIARRYGAQVGEVERILARLGEEQRNPDAAAMPVGSAGSGYAGELRIAITTAAAPNAGSSVAGTPGVTAGETAPQSHAKAGDAPAAEAATVADDPASRLAAGRTAAATEVGGRDSLERPATRSKSPSNRVVSARGGPTLRERIVALAGEGRSPEDIAEALEGEFGRRPSLKSIVMRVNEERRRGTLDAPPMRRVARAASPKPAPEAKATVSPHRLKPPARPVRPDPDLSSARSLIIAFPSDVLKRLQEPAIRRRVTVDQLVRELVAAVAEGDLVGAVLDR